MNSMLDNPIVEYDKIQWYQFVIGKLMYALVCTLKDIAFQVCLNKS